MSVATGSPMMDRDEREMLEVLDAAVRSAAAMIEPIITVVDRKLKERPDEVLAWETIPLEYYGDRLPESIRSSWVFVLRANIETGAERHPNSHQRMMSFRGGGDFQTQPEQTWVSHHLSSDPAAPLERRWISIPRNVWHQGVVGPEDWAVVSFHTVLEHELIEERPTTSDTEPVKQRKYADET
jgi:hypothetical protein